MANPKKMANPYPIRLEEELYLKLKIISEQGSRSMNKQIVLMLKKSVQSYESQHGEISVNPDDLYE